MTYSINYNYNNKKKMNSIKNNKTVEKDTFFYWECKKCGKHLYDILSAYKEGTFCICEEPEEGEEGREEQDEGDDDEELSYDCVVCKKHLYITEIARCNDREMCCECCLTDGSYCSCDICVANNEEESDEESDEESNEDDEESDEEY